MTQEFKDWCRRNNISNPDELDKAHFVGQIMKERNLHGIKIFDAILYRLT